MHEFLTDKAKEVLAAARGLAPGWRQPREVTCGDVLLALKLKGGGAAKCVLAQWLLGSDKTRGRVDAGPRAPDAAPRGAADVALSPSVEAALTRAGDHAARLGHGRTGCEHILMALLSDADGEGVSRLRQCAEDLPERIERQLADVAATDLFDRDGRPALEYEESAEVQRYAGHPDVARLRAGIAEYCRRHREQWEKHHALFREDRKKADDRAVLDEHFDALTRLGAGASALRLELGALVQRLKYGDAGGDAYGRAGAGALMQNATPRLRRIVARAQASARRLGHGSTSPDHLLLALIEEGEGIGLTMLRLAAGDLEGIRQALLEHAGGGFPAPPGCAPDVPLSEATEQCLGLAWTKSRMLHHARTGSEHLLWGIVTRGEGAAAAEIRAAGVTADRLDEAFWVLLGRFGGEGEKYDALRAAIASPLTVPTVRDDYGRVKVLVEAMDEAVRAAEYERAVDLRDKARAIQWGWVERCGAGG